MAEIEEVMTDIAEEVETETTVMIHIEAAAEIGKEEAEAEVHNTVTEDKKSTEDNAQDPEITLLMINTEEIITEEDTGIQNHQDHGHHLIPTIVIEVAMIGIGNVKEIIVEEVKKLNNFR
jgi:hypothetical protein